VAAPPLAGFPIGARYAILSRMATRRLKRPRDPIQLGKLIVDIATGQVEDQVDDGRDSHAVELGRSQSMTPERRAEIARKAAAKRWGKE
jgi:hypothetical protein